MLGTKKGGPDRRMRCWAPRSAASEGGVRLNCKEQSGLVSSEAPGPASRTSLSRLEFQRCAWWSVESQSKPIGIKLVYPEPCK